MAERVALHQGDLRNDSIRRRLAMKGTLTGISFVALLATVHMAILQENIPWVVYSDWRTARRRFLKVDLLLESTGEIAQAVVCILLKC